MNELRSYSDAVNLAKIILHGRRDETMHDAGRIIRFMASQETEYVPKLLAEIERLNGILKQLAEFYDWSDSDDQSGL